MYWSQSELILRLLWIQQQEVLGLRKQGLYCPPTRAPLHRLQPEPLLTDWDYYFQAYSLQLPPYFLLYTIGKGILCRNKAYSRFLLRNPVERPSLVGSIATISVISACVAFWPILFVNDDSTGGGLLPSWWSWQFQQEWLSFLWESCWGSDHTRSL